MTIVKLQVNRTQWAVGNGFFHSGHLSTDVARVDYVYDCGALSPGANRAALAREITELASRTQQLQFMFVSHFDYDHVSGIPQLAASVKIGKFIIPLISPEERLLLFARSIYNDSSQAGPRADAFYAALIVSPEDALRSVGDDVNEQPEVETVPAAVPDGPDGVDGPELLPPRDLRGAGVAATLTLKDTASRGIEAQVASSAVWEWFPYVTTQASSATRRFAQELKARKLIRRRRDLRNVSVLEDLVLNKQNELIKAYDKLLRAVGKSFTRNLTSLMLYSGPALGKRYRAYRTAPLPVERAEHGAWNPRPGWLGLGDADLRAKKRISEVNRVFLSRKALVGTFAPSHHGSKLDWSKDLLEGFDQDGRRVPTFVFGASGAYRSRNDKAVLHPDGDVILDINEFGGTTVIVGLAEASRWTEAQGVYVEY